MAKTTGLSLISLLLILVTCINMANAQAKINITIDGKTMVAKLADNDATAELVKKLASGPVIISMSDYGGFEKVGSLPWSLPTSDSRITTKPGDIMLYMGNNLVIFYGANTWSYTPIGIFETTDSSLISDFVGSGDKKVELSLSTSSDIETVYIDSQTRADVYSLDGKLVSLRPLLPGAYIVKQKKVIVK